MKQGPQPSAFLLSFPRSKRSSSSERAIFDERLDRQLHLGCKQVVILGAGLDTRSIRKQTSGVVYFEIDDGTTLSFKKSQLEANHIGSDVRFISANYIRDGLIGLLKQNEFDAPPPHLIWEGNTMYLTAASIRQVMVDISHHVKQFSLSLDYLTPAVIAKTTGDPGVTGIAESFAAMGAPWSYGIANIHGFGDEQPGD